MNGGIPLNYHINELDRIRVNHGKQKLLMEWRRLYKEEFEKAIDLINHSTLTFPTLFLLYNDVDVNDLSKRNRIAVHHIHNTLLGTDKGIYEEKHFSDQHHEVMDSFYWMIKTGGYNLINPNYVQVIDFAAIQSLIGYRTSLKNEVINIIFFRHRHRIHRHYLMWSFYEAAEPKNLFHIASFLYSSSIKDQQLSRSILHFIPNLKQIPDPIQAYKYTRYWLLENNNYLVKSDETNDTSPNPTTFYLDYFSKYLGIYASTVAGYSENSMSKFEQELKQKFNNLTMEQQSVLAQDSNRRRLTNTTTWYNWIMQPLDKQLYQLRR